jgi:hypothetical protein
MEVLLGWRRRWLAGQAVKLEPTTLGNSEQEFVLSWLKTLAVRTYEWLAFASCLYKIIVRMFDMTISLDGIHAVLCCTLMCEWDKNWLCRVSSVSEFMFYCTHVLMMQLLNSQSFKRNAFSTTVAEIVLGSVRHILNWEHGQKFTVWPISHFAQF